MKHLLLAGMIFLMAGCTTWSEPADSGQTVVLDLEAQTADGPVSMRTTAVAGYQNGLGAAIDQGLPGIRSGETITQHVGLYVRNGTLGPFPAVLQVGVDEFRQVTQREPMVGLVIGEPTSDRYYEVVSVGSSVTLRVAHDDGTTLDLPALGALVTLRMRGDQLWYDLDVVPGSRVPLGTGTQGGFLGLPGGTYVSFANRGEQVVYARVDEPRPATCPDSSAPSLVAPGTVQVARSPANTKMPLAQREVTVVACHFDGPVAWTWTAPGAPADFTFAPAGGTLRFDAPRSENVTALTLRATAAAGDQVATLTFVVDLLREGESNEAAQMVATVLRVQAMPESVPADGNWAAGPTTVVEGTKVQTISVAPPLVGDDGQHA